jgi:hypothetical protein
MEALKKCIYTYSTDGLKSSKIQIIINGILEVVTLFIISQIIITMYIINIQKTKNNRIKALKLFMMKIESLKTD